MQDFILFGSFGSVKASF